MAEYQKVVDQGIESLVNLPSYASDLAEGAAMGAVAGTDLAGTIWEGSLEQYSDSAAERSASEKTSMGWKAWDRVEEKAERMDRSHAPLYLGRFGGLAAGGALNSMTSFAPAALAAYLDTWNSDTLHDAYDATVDFYNRAKETVASFTPGYNDHVERSDEVMADEDPGFEEVDETLEGN